MGGSDLPQADSVGSLFANLEAKVAMQATSQGLGNSKVQGGATEYTDVNGNETINQGTYTYLTGPWAGVTLRGSTIYFDPMGNPIMVLGPQPDGKTGLGMYNPAGTRLQFFDFTGLTSSDTAGNPRSLSGLLPSGDFGLAVFDRSNSGAYQEVLPLLAASSTTTVPVTSTGWTYLNATVTAIIGASGSAYVRASSQIGPSTNNLTGNGQVAIDGVTSPVSTAFCSLIASSSGTEPSGGLAASASIGQKITGLTPGTHTFALYGNSSTGATVNYSVNSVEVQPL